MVDALRGDEQPKTADEYQEKLVEFTEEVYKKAKPSSVSGELSTPSLVTDYIELAKKSGGFKMLTPMRKTHRTDAKGNIKTSKATKKPLWDWVLLEANYKSEPKHTA